MINADESKYTFNNFFPETNQIVLSKVFMATLDGGKHRFPKQVWMYAAVIDKKLIPIINAIPKGSSVIAKFPIKDRVVEKVLIGIRPEK
ncbi:MAG: hypothetical protein CVU46_11030 [Chloroflexi bacterium HGW-Chloroflexi-8]|jgi:hypothetical protein|nr:MAG: hypothetical protein CVU46_11030 [Chloroflexi bacterium HGW-Chloroflexi-8]